MTEPVGKEASRRLRLVVGGEAGRAETFQQLIERELDAAYRLAAVILNDRFEAEDAVHDAVEAAWQHFRDLRDPGRFDAWFRRILVNRCRDRLRARARHRVVDIGRELTPDEHPVAADVAGAAALRDAVDRAIETLGPDDRLLIALRFFADLTVPAVAATLDIPEGTVKSRLHHALGRLRERLEEGDR